MNVISTRLSHHLFLEFIPLSKAGFSGMSMCTADNKEIALQHIVKFTLNIQGIIRPVQAFVAPPDNNTSASWFSLLLGIPWLYQVDATIRIRQFAVTIGDKNVGETPRDIAEAAELGFSKEHTLIMYPRAVLKSLGEEVETESDNATSSSSESDSDLDNDDEVSLSNADEIHPPAKTQNMPKPDFP